MSRKQSVKDAVFATIKQEIEAGRLKYDQLLNPYKHGQANDTAMIIQQLTTLSGYTAEQVRAETVLRYVRQFKAIERRKAHNA